MESLFEKKYETKQKNESCFFWICKNVKHNSINMYDIGLKF